MPLLPGRKTGGGLGNTGNGQRMQEDVNQLGVHRRKRARRRRGLALPATQSELQHAGPVEAPPRNTAGPGGFHNRPHALRHTNAGRHAAQPVDGRLHLRRSGAVAGQAELQGLLRAGLRQLFVGITDQHAVHPGSQRPLDAGKIHRLPGLRLQVRHQRRPDPGQHGPVVAGARARAARRVENHPRAKAPLQAGRTLGRPGRRPPPATLPAREIGPIRWDHAARGGYLASSVDSQDTRQTGTSLSQRRGGGNRSSEAAGSGTAFSFVRRVSSQRRRKPSNAIGRCAATAGRRSGKRRASQRKGTAPSSAAGQSVPGPPWGLFGHCHGNPAVPL